MDNEQLLSSNKSPITVSQLSELLRTVLESNFPYVCIEGEISNYRPSSVGHSYFTLKDNKAAISAVMFKTKTRFLTFEPKDGMKVKVSGSISVYMTRGTYQISVEKMEEIGEGNILQLLEQRKRKLDSEGYFDSSNKQQIPFFPKTIGIVTSPTGAALHDILQITHRRNPKVSVIVFPCPVQGNEAAPLITAQINYANEHNMVDLLIIGRGGGSLEDLLPFSEEIVVKAIAQSKIPIISAVGHEIDWALSDYAADIRASTPSAAAEIAVPLLTDIEDVISRSKSNLEHNITTKLEAYKNLIRTFSVDNLELRFRTIEQPLLQKFEDAKTNLFRSINQRISDKRQKLEILTNTLQQVNPKTILERGFSLVYTKDGKIVKNAEDINTGDKLIITPYQGSIEVTVDNQKGEING